MKAWQTHWDEGNKSTSSMQYKDLSGRNDSNRGKNSREQQIILRLRIGHTGLNKTIQLIGKHPSGNVYSMLYDIVRSIWLKEKS